jgi:hypothetical protein
MKGARRIRRRWVRGVALGLTVAAVAVPAAQAYDYHQPFGANIESTSLPCAPGCSVGADSTTSAHTTLEQSHPRGGLVVAGSMPDYLNGRTFGPGWAGPVTTLAAFSHLGRGPGFQLPVGAGVQSNETTVDWSAVGAGIGIGGAFALLVAGLFSMRRPQSGEPVRA